MGDVGQRRLRSLAAAAWGLRVPTRMSRERERDSASPRARIPALLRGFLSLRGQGPIRAALCANSRQPLGGFSYAAPYAARRPTAVHYKRRLAQRAADCTKTASRAG